MLIKISQKIQHHSKIRPLKIQREMCSKLDIQFYPTFIQTYIVSTGMAEVIIDIYSVILLTCN